MKDFCAFLEMRRYKNWAHKIGSWKYLNYRKSCSAVFPQSTECLIFALHPELFSGSVEGQQLQQHLPDSILGGRWQVPICSWHCLLKELCNPCLYMCASSSNIALHHLCLIVSDPEPREHAHPSPLCLCILRDRTELSLAQAGASSTQPQDPLAKPH